MPRRRSVDRLFFGHNPPSLHGCAAASPELAVPKSKLPIQRDGFVEMKDEYIENGGVPFKMAIVSAIVAKNRLLLLRTGEDVEPAEVSTTRSILSKEFGCGAAGVSCFHFDKAAPNAWESVASSQWFLFPSQLSQIVTIKADAVI